MKNSYVAIFYVVGFIIFYSAMDILKIDKFVSKLLTDKPIITNKQGLYPGLFILI